MKDTREDKISEAHMLQGCVNKNMLKKEVREVTVKGTWDVA